MKDTCAALEDFRSNAGSLAGDPPPAGAEPAQWSTATKDLNDAVAALDEPCKSNNAATFEQAFHRVHESFHNLTQLAGGGQKHADDKPHDEHKM